MSLFMLMTLVISSKKPLALTRGSSLGIQLIDRCEMTEEVKDVNGVDASRLLSLLERIEHLDEEIKDLKIDQKEIFEEAKSAGFDIKAMKEMLKLRKKDDKTRQEEEFVLDVYKQALGMN